MPAACSDQLDLALRQKGRGGARKGAGRKRSSHKVGHDARPKLTGDYPLHVTLRVLPEIGNLRERRRLRTIEDCFRAAKDHLGLRLIHYSVQSTHIHLIVEAATKETLAVAMQGLKVRIARALNKLLARTGAVFADRYHSRALPTPQESKNALAYVILNDRHHAHDHRVHVNVERFDPCSSAAFFDGWKGIPPVPVQPNSPVAAARCWMLRVGWKRGGLLAPDTIPGRSRRSSITRGRRRAG